MIAPPAGEKDRQLTQFRCNTRKISVSVVNVVSVVSVVSADLSRITTELWEIPIFSPADGALILNMLTEHYFFGVIFFPS